MHRKLTPLAALLTMASASGALAQEAAAPVAAAPVVAAPAAPAAVPVVVAPAAPAYSAAPAAPTVIYMMPAAPVAPAAAPAPACNCNCTQTQNAAPAAAPAPAPAPAEAPAAAPVAQEDNKYRFEGFNLRLGLYGNANPHHADYGMSIGLDYRWTHFGLFAEFGSGERYRLPEQDRYEYDDGPEHESHSAHTLLGASFFAHVTERFALEFTPAAVHFVTYGDDEDYYYDDLENHTWFHTRVGAQYRLGEDISIFAHVGADLGGKISKDSHDYEDDSKNAFTLKVANVTAQLGVGWHF